MCEYHFLCEAVSCFYNCISKCPFTCHFPFCWDHAEKLDKLCLTSDAFKARIWVSFFFPSSCHINAWFLLSITSSSFLTFYWHSRIILLVIQKFEDVWVLRPFRMRWCSPYYCISFTEKLEKIITRNNFLVLVIVGLGSNPMLFIAIQ